MMQWGWRKLTLLGLFLALATAAVIWVAWELEEGKKPVRTRVVGQTDEGNLVVELDEKESFDLIVHCDEEKFQDAFEQFRKHVEVESPYPPLKVPGGPMVIALADLELPEELQPAKRAAVEYLKRHSPRRVILVAHSECLYYDTIAAWQDNLAEVKQRQHEHLVKARQVILNLFPQTEVELYYADRSGDRLTFLRMSDELPPPTIELKDETSIEPED